MKKISELMQKQFDKMCQTGKLFRSNLTGKEIWKLYLENFKEHDNPIFRDPESSMYNCNTCNNFIRRYGNIVSINKKLKLETIFDIAIDKENEYYSSFKIIRSRLKVSKIENIFIESFKALQELPYESCKKSQESFKLGITVNHKTYTQEEVDKFGKVTLGKVYTFNHFNLQLPSKFVDTSNKSVDTIMADFKSAYDVFKRGMKELPLSTLLVVKDLILQGSLLNGNAYLDKLNTFIELKEHYNKITTEEAQDVWCWDKSYNFKQAKFKNELIGVLCTELAEGKELNKVCKDWNIRIDPVNYMKATSPITKTQKEDAQKFVEENGYIDSFDRRFANIEDVKVEEIKHINIEKSSLGNVSIFDNVKVTPSTRHKKSKFDNIEEVTIDKFMADILPTCSSVELLLLNRFENNLVSLTTSNKLRSKPMFKWDNNFSWTYNGNLTGKSEIKEAVKTHKGKVDGVLRFSIMWSEDSNDNSDLDARCNINNRRIYYLHKIDSISQGQLDVDITEPDTYKYKNLPVIENITFPSIEKLNNSICKFRVHQFSKKGKGNFRAEIAFNNEIFQYEYKNDFSNHTFIDVAEVKIKNSKFSIKHILPEISLSKSLWGLDTNTFHKVNLMCLSPNYWGKNAVGHKHYFFMLNRCKSPDNTRSFHNENLNSELTKHRKVLDVLGETTKLKPSAENYLAGVGFNSTVKDEIVLRLKGNFNRIIKVKL